MFIDSRTIAMAVALPTAMQAVAAKAPNIILFLVDDMGWQDTSVPFAQYKSRLNGVYETPNMEKLAAEGMCFTQAYASPISSPSRCSLMSGSNAARHGVTNWTLERDRSTDCEDGSLQPPVWNYNGISPVPGVPHTYHCKSFVQILHEHGYHTIHCGKAHWGAQHTLGELPTAWGFDVNIAGHAGGGPATYLSEQNYGHRRDGIANSPFAVPGLQSYWGTGAFLTEALTQEALKALDKAKQYGVPFFLNMSHYAVHIPIDRDMRFFTKYVRKGLSDKEAAYASLVEGMDKSLGDLLKWLRENGEEENTIIIFMSDNGGYATGSYWRDEPLYTQNAPLRCGKGSMYEGGIREPMIVKWPGRVKGASRCDQYLLIEDFFPSILEMAGVCDYQVPQVIDGESFVPLLDSKAKSSKERMLVWNYPNVWGNEGPGISLNCAVRIGDWKLIYSYKTGKHELYNLREDIAEAHDVAQENPSVVRKLSLRLSAYLRKVGAQRPVVKSTGKPCVWPDGIE